MRPDASVASARVAAYGAAWVSPHAWHRHTHVLAAPEAGCAHLASRVHVPRFEVTGPADPDPEDFVPAAERDAVAPGARWEDATVSAFVAALAGPMPLADLVARLGFSEVIRTDRSTATRITDDGRPLDLLKVAVLPPIDSQRYIVWIYLTRFTDGPAGVHVLPGPAWAVLTTCKCTPRIEVAVDLSRRQ